MSTKLERQNKVTDLEKQRAQLDSRAASLEEEARRLGVTPTELDRKCIFQYEARGFRKQSTEIGRQIAALLEEDLRDD